MKCKHYYAVIFVCALNLIFLNNIFCEELPSLGFYEVTVDQEEIRNAEYDIGSKLFPNFALYGLPEKFYIKKQASLSLYKNDIEKIRIEQAKSYPASQECYSFTIALSQKANKDWKQFTKRNIKKRFALKIGNDIFTIAFIVMELDSDISSIHCDKNFNEIYDCFSKISSNIVDPDSIR